MKNDEVSANPGAAWSRATQDAAVEDLRQSQHDLHKAHARIAQLEAALARASSTAEMVAFKTEAEGLRRNVNEAVREGLITSLQSDNKQLLIRIDKNILDLASAEERLQDLSTELILAHEKEQRRIAREMHDELGQDLTALKMLITRGKNAKEDEANELWMQAGEISETLLQTVRDICSQLRPQVLDDLGLIAGLSVHLKNFGHRSGLTIELTHGAIDENRLTPIVQSVIFRVIQEALTNVARHAKTECAWVSIRMEGDTLVFKVEDKGCGFLIEQAKDNPSTGLSSMAERVMLVHGVYEIVSNRNAGTVVTARIPLKVEATGAHGGI